MAFGESLGQVLHRLRLSPARPVHIAAHPSNASPRGPTRGPKKTTGTSVWRPPSYLSGACLLEAPPPHPQEERRHEEQDRGAARAGVLGCDDVAAVILGAALRRPGRRATAAGRA